MNTRNVSTLVNEGKHLNKREEKHIKFRCFCEPGLTEYFAEYENDFKKSYGLYSHQISTQFHTFNVHSVYHNSSVMWSMKVLDQG